MLTALTTLAEDFNYTYDAPTATSTSTSGGGVAAVLGIIYMLVIILMIVSLWKVFTKAGKPGWSALIPFYNTIQLLSIAGRPLWWIFLMLIPLVNLVIVAIVMNDIAKSFGRGTGTTLLLFFLPFVGYPILAFGSATYRGPSANGVGTTPAAPTSSHGGGAPQPPFTPVS